MKGLPAETDFIVIGAGIAGLRAAIELADAGRVLVLTKKDLPNFKAKDAKSEAEWLNDADDVILHLQDTIAAGDGLSNAAAAKARRATSQLVRAPSYTVCACSACRTT